MWVLSGIGSPYVISGLELTVNVCTTILVGLPGLLRWCRPRAPFRYCAPQKLDLNEYQNNARTWLPGVGRGRARRVEHLPAVCETIEFCSLDLVDRRWALHRSGHLVTVRTPSWWPQLLLRALAKSLTVISTIRVLKSVRRDLSSRCPSTGISQQLKLDSTNEALCTARLNS